MSNNNYGYSKVVKYNSWNNTIKFPTKIGSYIIADFSSALKEWVKKRPYDMLTFDFQSTMQPYSNGMLPIIATITDLRLKKSKIRILWPNDSKVKKIFKETNWGHFLDPNTYPKTETSVNRHLVTRQFTDFKDVAWITNEFMQVVLSNMKVPKDIISALEWSINEICDNVINHSASKVGGFVEVLTFPKQEQVTFTVADAGIGILNSLKEGIPTLRTDIEAIGEAIKTGVTRNKDVGQGNGLAGSLRITSMSQGSLDIISGNGRFFSIPNDNKKSEGNKLQTYKGTSVSGVIKMNKSFSIVKALDFDGLGNYKPVNLIDLFYEMPDKDCLQILMKDETTGFGTRAAGRQLRTKTLNLMNAKPSYPIYVDWEGVPIVSSSFADEFMGKLFLELGPLAFSSIIRNNGMEDLVRQLLDKAISQRLKQSLN